MSYEKISARMDIDMPSTIREWTNQDTDENRFFQDAYGTFHMDEQAAVEEPTNILYMLYPNGHEESQEYPYPGEYEPYSMYLFNESHTPSDNAAAAPVTPRKKYARRKKIDATTTPTEGGSTRSAGAGPSSAPKTPTRTSPRKRATPNKPTPSRKAQAPAALDSHKY